MLAIAVGAVVAVGAISLFERAGTRVREQRFVQQVATLAQGVRGLYENAGAPPYGPPGNVDITARVFGLGLGTPDSRSTNSYLNAYGRALTVATSGAFFTVTSIVPADACISAWQKIPGLHGLQISGGAVPADLFAPFDPAAQSAIVAACAGAGPFTVSYRFQ
jgi:hypothetical protein